MLDRLALSDAEMLDAHLELAGLATAEYYLNFIRHLKRSQIPDDDSHNVILLLTSLPLLIEHSFTD